MPWKVTSRVPDCRFARRSGRFGLWMSSNDWNSQEARDAGEVARSREEGIMAEVMVLEAWSDETTFYIWNDAEYTTNSATKRASTIANLHFLKRASGPNPKAMIDGLHERGLTAVLWQIPVMKAARTRTPSRTPIPPF